MGCEENNYSMFNKEKGARTTEKSQELRESKASKTFGYINDALFKYFSFQKVVYDQLHMDLRIPENFLVIFLMIFKIKTILTTIKHIR